MYRRDLFKSAETFSEAALTRIAADLLLFQRRLVAGMLRLVTRSLRADLFRFDAATRHKRDEGMVASFIRCHRLRISMFLGWGWGLTHRASGRETRTEARWAAASFLGGWVRPNAVKTRMREIKRSHESYNSACGVQDLRCIA